MYPGLIRHTERKQYQRAISTKTHRLFVSIWNTIYISPDTFVNLENVWTSSRFWNTSPQGIASLIGSGEKLDQKFNQIAILEAINADYLIWHVGRHPQRHRRRWLSQVRVNWTFGARSRWVTCLWSGRCTYHCASISLLPLRFGRNAVL